MTVQICFVIQILPFKILRKLERGETERQTDRQTDRQREVENERRVWSGCDGEKERMLINRQTDRNIGT